MQEESHYRLKRSAGVCECLYCNTLLSLMLRILTMKSFILSEIEVGTYCGVRDKKLILYSQGARRFALKEKEVHKRYVILG